ncbi:hypothetical protein CsatB_008724 [Cannabis sativa]
MSICLQMQEVEDNCMYLGIPNIMGQNKSVVLGFLIERVQKNIQSWDAKFPSKVGKEVLLKMAAQSLPNFAISLSDEQVLVEIFIELGVLRIFNG